MIGIVSGLTSQKGFRPDEKARLPRLLSPSGISRWPFLAVAMPSLRKVFDSLHRRIPRRVSFYRGFNNKLAHWIEAGADMFLMPSRYEPCGLNQMYSLKYGTVPIVRETGGLADSVQQVNPSNRHRNRESCFGTMTKRA